MRAQESVRFTNISATPARFVLSGGKYQLSGIGTGFGTINIRQLGPDGVVTISQGTLAANGVLILDAMPGVFELTITTVTAVHAAIVRIPGE